MEKKTTAADRAVPPACFPTWHAWRLVSWVGTPQAGLLALRVMLNYFLPFLHCLAFLLGLNDFFNGKTLCRNTC